MKIHENRREYSRLFCYAAPSSASCRCAAIWGDATLAVTAVITASANTPKIRRLSMKNHPASCFANSLQGGFA
ncbi:hypothetical protein HMPREF1545_03608 [Oscillibacter sp. KLE 1728]|nr:hypothetical protein HMPREF1545_03608 [Oscillibacter sp. KLE 1728]ERK61989.1 hypothetical protein HMPREF1546_02880 [Oscillibacter sp. KLE 1745]